jgi:aspartyl-tRNA(Asn)/glutamyl-tRNA(Gln) amidotransferase subunit B
MTSCPVCRGETIGQAVLNQKALSNALLVALALDCELEKSIQNEKNSTTPEVPSSVALTGLSARIARAGYLEILFHGRKKAIRISELRIEEDAGRLTHSGKRTRMDYSNAGMPSLRIRTEADFEIGEEVSLFLEVLCRRIQYLEIIQSVPVESVLRCNAHVAVCRYPETPGSYVKLRNLNSFNFAKNAVNSELLRQESILSTGGEIEVESRYWNESRSLTEPFKKRTVDSVSTFTPLPDCSPVTLSDDVLSGLRSQISDLPESRRRSLVSDFGLTPSQAEFLADEKSRADYFEKAVSFGARPRDAVHWMSSFVLKELKQERDPWPNLL